VTQRATKKKPSRKNKKSVSLTKQTKCNILKHIRRLHIAESFPLKGGASIHIERINKRLKADRKSARRRQHTYTHTMKVSKNKAKYKYACKGEQ
jgi:hypothetical protein